MEKMKIDDYTFNHWMTRSRIENEEHWEQWAKDIPSLNFDSDWNVKIIPPFASAIIRFCVEKNGKSVSVYFDRYSQLGYMVDKNDELIPYWEVYTNDDDYPHRYLMDETTELIEDIRSILNKDI